MTYALSIGAEIIYLAFPLTTKTHVVAEKMLLLGDLDKRPLIIKLKTTVPEQIINVIFSTERRIFTRGRYFNICE